MSRYPNLTGDPRTDRALCNLALLLDEIARNPEPQVGGGSQPRPIADGEDGQQVKGIARDGGQQPCAA